jgi:hypothetical protein
MVEIAYKWLHKGVIGIDRAGKESLKPLKFHQEVILFIFLFLVGLSLGGYFYILGIKAGLIL